MKIGKIKIYKLMKKVLKLKKKISQLESRLTVCEQKESEAMDDLDMDINIFADMKSEKLKRIEEDAEVSGINLNSYPVQKILGNYTNYWYAKRMLLKFIKIRNYFEKNTILHLPDARELLSLSYAATSDTLTILEKFGILKLYSHSVDKSIVCYTYDI